MCDFEIFSQILYNSQLPLSCQRMFLVCLLHWNHRCTEHINEHWTLKSEWIMWLSNVMDLRSTGRGFDSRLPHCQAVTLGKLLIHVSSTSTGWILNYLQCSSFFFRFHWCRPSPLHFCNSAIGLLVHILWFQTLLGWLIYIHFSPDYVMMVYVSVLYV